MQKDAEPSQATRMDRRSFLKSAAAGTAALATGVSLLSWGRPLQAAGLLKDVQADAAESGKITNGRVVTLRILASDPWATSSRWPRDGQRKLELTWSTSKFPG